VADVADDEAVERACRAALSEDDLDLLGINRDGSPRDA
jgi:hypothetical protein